MVFLRPVIHGQKKPIQDRRSEQPIAAFEKNLGLNFPALEPNKFFTQRWSSVAYQVKIHRRATAHKIMPRPQTNRNQQQMKQAPKLFAE